MSWKRALTIPAAGLVALATRDLLQRQHARRQRLPRAAAAPSRP